MIPLMTCNLHPFRKCYFHYVYANTCPVVSLPRWFENDISGDWKNSTGWHLEKVWKMILTLPDIDDHR